MGNKISSLDAALARTNADREARKKEREAMGLPHEEDTGAVILTQPSTTEAHLKGVEDGGKKPDMFEKMYPLLTKKLRRGKGGAMQR